MGALMLELIDFIFEDTCLVQITLKGWSLTVKSYETSLFL